MLTKIIHMTLLNSCYVCKNVVIHFSYGMRFGHLYAVQTSERSDWANLNCNVHATPPQLKRHPSHLRASNSFLLTREMLFISNVRFICKIWSMKIWFVGNPLVPGSFLYSFWTFLIISIVCFTHICDSM